MNPQPVSTKTHQLPAGPVRLAKAAKTLGTWVLYFGAFVGVLLLIAVFFRGGAWLSQRVTPWLFDISWVTLQFVICGILPLCASKETRGLGGSALGSLSYFFGVTAWFWSVLIVYTIWGPFALVIGLMIAGVGVLPIALLATLVKGNWAVFGELILLLVLTFGTRAFGAYCVVSNDRDSGETDMPIKLIVATWLLFGACFIPFVGYVALLPFIVCAFMLLFSKNCRVRKHGMFAAGIVVVIVVGGVLIGYAFYDKLPNFH